MCDGRVNLPAIDAPRASNQDIRIGLRSFSAILWESQQARSIATLKTRSANQLITCRTLVMEVSDSIVVARRRSVRPPQAPLGPRTRQRSSNLSLETAGGSHYSRESIVYSPDPGSPARSIAPSPDRKSLSIISEGSVHTEAPAPTISSDDDRPVLAEPPTSPPTPPTPSPPEVLVVKSIPKSNPLTPLTQIKFDSVPVQWKGIPLEAALCESSGFP